MVDVHNLACIENRLLTGLTSAGSVKASWLLNIMNSASTQFIPSGRVVLYEPQHQMAIWGQSFKSGSSPNDMSAILVPNGNIDNSCEVASQGNQVTPKKLNLDRNKLPEKVLRRLAQNREAARKSRLRKKAYVQNLESSRIKLTQLEQELERAMQGVYTGGNLGDGRVGLPSSASSGIAQFEMEYAHWVKEQERLTSELRNALQIHVTDIDLRILVESAMGHYDLLFRLKAAAAKSDVFFVISGVWKSAAEQFFLWIGGFRPSELLKVLIPHLDTLTDQQRKSVSNLQRSSQQAEDALTQGMEKLQQTLSDTLTRVTENYIGQMTAAMGKLEALISFVNQADHLRQQALKQMFLILTTRQAARALFALGDYFQRLRALSSAWAVRPQEPA